MQSVSHGLLHHKGRRVRLHSLTCSAEAMHVGSKGMTGNMYSSG